MKKLKKNVSIDCDHVNNSIIHRQNTNPAQKRIHSPYTGPVYIIILAPFLFGKKAI